MFAPSHPSPQSSSAPLRDCLHGQSRPLPNLQLRSLNLDTSKVRRTSPAHIWSCLVLPVYGHVWSCPYMVMFGPAHIWSCFSPAHIWYVLSVLQEPNLSSSLPAMRPTTSSSLLVSDISDSDVDSGGEPSSCEEMASGADSRLHGGRQTSVLCLNRFSQPLFCVVTLHWVWTPVARGRRRMRGGRR